MELVFENKRGCIQFGGRSPWKITDYSGFGPAQKSFQTVTYATMPGQVTLSERQEARTMTLRGDCRGDRRVLSEGLQVLHQPGMLTVNCDGQRKRIQVYCTHVEVGNPKGTYREFVLQFTADNPNFEEMEEKQFSLFRKEDLIQGSFSLPCIFTERVSGGVVVNNGDVSSDPVFVITGISELEGDASGIVIENVTTKSRLQLDYVIRPGETVTVDVANRKVYSNVETEGNQNGNLLGFLSADTFLHQLVLEPGRNQMVISPESLCKQYAIQCRFREKYLEAVI